MCSRRRLVYYYTIGHEMGLRLQVPAAPAAKLRYLAPPPARTLGTLKVAAARYQMSYCSPKLF